MDQKHAPTSEATKPSTQKKWVYIGPEYKYHIKLPGDAEAYDPKGLGDKERELFIAKYPPAKDWWVQQ